MTSTTRLGTDTRRLELYVRVSLYVLLLMEPLVVAGAAGPRGQGAIAALTLLHSLANLAVCRWSLTAMRGRPITVSRRVLTGLLGWAALSLGLMAATASLTVWASGLSVPLVVLGTTLGSICPLLDHGSILAVVLAGAVATALVVRWRLDLSPAASASLALAAALGLAAVVYSFWLSGWMLRVVYELVEARRRAAQLAVAEERLRIARDLHDLFGRTLAAVALKSELASELLRRGRAEQAASEIGAVRALAEETGSEVRQVVRGFRRTDLSSELVGARALLDSAGIRCVVHAEGADGLLPDAADALAWILREAVTNVIRHSDARECFVTLSTGDPVRLMVTNDGAPAPGPGRSPGTTVSGAGLVGMAERAAAVGGHVVPRQVDDRFTVEARIPTERANALEVTA